MTVIGFVVDGVTVSSPQWANFSPLVNVRELNLVSNELTDITTMGLSCCTTLHVLLLSGNRIAAEANLHYLSFLPALDIVDLRDNPVMAISHARYASIHAGVLLICAFRGLVAWGTFDGVAGRRCCTGPHRLAVSPPATAFD